MTPELQMVIALGGKERHEQEKVAASFDEMSIEELAGVVRGDVEKIAGPDWKKLATYKAVGKNFKKAPTFGKNTSLGARIQSSKGLTSGNAGITERARGTLKDAVRFVKRKISSADLENLSIEQLSEIVRADGDLEKVAFSPMLGTALRGVAKAGTLGRIGGGAAIGAATGAVGHAASGDPRSSLGRKMVGGALLGAGAGAAAMPALRAGMKNSQSVNQYVQGSMNAAKKGAKAVKPAVAAAPAAAPAAAAAVKPAAPAVAPAAAPVPPPASVAAPVAAAATPTTPMTPAQMVAQRRKTALELATERHMAAQTRVNAAGQQLADPGAAAVARQRALEQMKDESRANIMAMRNARTQPASYHGSISHAGAAPESFQAASTPLRRAARATRIEQPAMPVARQRQLLAPAGTMAY